MGMHVALEFKFATSDGRHKDIPGKNWTDQKIIDDEVIAKLARKASRFVTFEHKYKNYMPGDLDATEYRVRFMKTEYVNVDRAGIYAVRKELWGEWSPWSKL